MNAGQLAMLVRARYLIDARSYAKVRGVPFFAEELETEMLRVMDE
jgi:2-oxoglutarate ferredoxin oxidoreductase subunit alpha